MEKKKLKIYIAGKVTGEDYQLCFNKFKAAEELLNGLGFQTLNPLSVIQQGTNWVDAMDQLRPHLINSDIVMFLPDWKFSKGSQLEYEWAKHYNKKIVDYGNIYGELLNTPADVS